MVLAGKIIKAILVHPLGTINICRKVHGKPTNFNYFLDLLDNLVKYTNVSLLNENSWDQSH